MNVTNLLDQLAQQNIQLWVEGDKLKFRAPKGSLTPEQRVLLKQHIRQLFEYPTIVGLAPVVETMLLAEVDE